MSKLEALRKRAEALGLWAQAAPLRVPEEHQGRFAVWLSAGRHAGMRYLERTKDARLHPERAFPWAKSVLVLAAPYAFPELPVPEGGLRIGRVARYAWTRDYHRALEAALLELENEARRLGLLAKGYVDYGPLLEGPLGAAAGLGWIGKNTLLLREGFGSYLLLAALLTDAEAEPAPPAPTRCGRCTRCLFACPTGALDARGLDANRCISYWTIETRAPIPLELWDAFGEWLFGCDDCQIACPWNRFAGEAGYWRGFSPEPGLAHPDLWDFVRLSNQGFAKKYGDTAFARPGRAGMARNAIRLLGALGHEALEAYLEAASKDPSPTVRKAAAQAFFRLGTPRLLDDPDPGVRALARGLFG